MFYTLINRIYENETTSNNIKLDLGQNKPRKRICLKQEKLFRYMTINIRNKSTINKPNLKI